MVSTISLWCTQNHSPSPFIRREIANDNCESMVNEIINPKNQLVVVKAQNTSATPVEKAYKFKTSIWNKIISAKDFENFNDLEYFRWIAIYQDSGIWNKIINSKDFEIPREMVAYEGPESDISRINPVSIEQKMALIEVITARLTPTLISTDKKLSLEVEKLNALKLRKLQTKMRNLDLSSNLTRHHLEDAASEIMLVLKGPPVGLLDYLTKNKTKRMNERVMRMIQEDVLLIGLKGMVDRIPEKDSYKSLERGRYLIKRFFQYKIWKYLVLPYDLPWIDRVKIPQELLEKIMIEGLEAHDHELIALLNKQGMIDHYERFRKVYKPIAFSIGFYFYYDKFNDQMKGHLNENQEEEKKKFIQDFGKLSEGISRDHEETAKTEDDLKQEQYQRILENYRNRNGDPTPEDVEEIRLKIFGK